VIIIEIKKNKYSVPFSPNNQRKMGKLRYKKMYKVFLFYINEGYTLVEIKKKYPDIPKSTFYRWIKKMEREDLIELKFRDIFKFYKITDKGKLILRKITKGDSLPLYRLHNICFTYSLLETPDVTQGFRPIQRRGHTDYVKKEKDCTIEIIMGNSPKLLIHLKNIYGSSYDECIYTAATRANNVVYYYVEQNEWKVILPPKITKQWHVAYPSPKPVNESVRIDFGEYTFAIDKSKGYEEIEIQKNN